jgi:hypothetical protein
MVAKNKRLSAILDFQAAFTAHLDANTRAHEWAAKCLAYREAGNFAEANAAEQKARQWLKKALALEARAAIGNPQGGRREEL